MAEIVNLRQARKAKSRAQAEKDAAANRAAFGRTKAEKKLTEALVLARSSREASSNGSG